MYTHREHTAGDCLNEGPFAPRAVSSPPAAAIPSRSSATHAWVACSRPQVVSTRSCQPGPAPRAAISVAFHPPREPLNDTLTHHFATTYELCRQKRVSRQNAPATKVATGRHAFGPPSHEHAELPSSVPFTSASHSHCGVPPKPCHSLQSLVRVACRPQKTARATQQLTTV
jgi:hypothetical protein